MGTLVLLDLMGGVALLLWGLHMVLSGVLRAFGPDLRRFLSKALGNRFTAFGAGLVLTATDAEQYRDRADDHLTRRRRHGRPGARARDHARRQCRHDVDRAGVLLQYHGDRAGAVRHRPRHLPLRRAAALTKAVGRIAIGLGLTLLALHILLDTLAPAEQAPAARALIAAVTGDPVLCVVHRRGATWAAHSSVAVVLLVMSLAYSQFVTPAAALALVLGANLGSAINPLVEGRNPRRSGEPARALGQPDQSSRSASLSCCLSCSRSRGS